MDTNLFFAIKVYFGKPRIRAPEITDEPGSLLNYIKSVTLTLMLAWLLGLLIHVTVRRLTWCPPLKFTREAAANKEHRASIPSRLTDGNYMQSSPPGSEGITADTAQQWSGQKKRGGGRLLPVDKERSFKTIVRQYYM
ncbi:uncharacterized protein LOC144868714 [Branchiostoma floridae x Branchiostoma japonicum]